MSGPAQALWNMLLGTATLGTSRGAGRPIESWPGAPAWPAGGSQEQTLLRAAAALTVWLNAGRRAPARPAPAAADVAPPAREVTEEAALRLVSMLGGEHRDLVPEWFALAGHAGAVLPVHWLPPALTLLTPAERSRYASVLGEHAEWLAAQNDAWAIERIERPVSEERWQQGTLAERVTELRRLRRVDPERAVQWLDAAWPKESGDAREELIRVLAQDASPADEPLLERALDDRRKSVRAAAADLLSQRAESAHSRRMRDRLDPLVTFTVASRPAHGSTGPRVDVQLPPGLDKAAVRDGIEVKPPAGKGVGERLYWLMQMMAVVPPAHWVARFGAPPDVLIAGLLEGEHGPALVDAVSAAVARHGAADWVMPLARYWVTRTDDQEQVPSARAIVRLLSVLDPEERATALRAMLPLMAPASSAMGITLLNELDVPADADLTRVALAWLGDVCRRDRQEWAHPRALLLAWGRRADPAAAAPLLTDLAHACAADSPWRHVIRALTDLIDFRADMHKELSS